MSHYLYFTFWLSHGRTKRRAALWLVGLLGCANPSVDEPALRAYVQDPAHGLSHQVEAGPVTVTCTYRPSELLVAQELARTSQPPSAVTLDSLRRAYAGKTYFALSLAQNGVEIENRYLPNEQAFTQALTYLSTGIAADMFLVTLARDSIPALAAIYPRQYGATGRSTVLLVFNTRQLDLREGFHLTFRDRQFDLGTLHFPFAAADWQALPPLNL